MVFMYLISISSFWAVTQKITDKLKLNVFMHIWHLWVFHDDINVNVGTEVFQAES
jgi:hypothetical protein